MYDLLLLYICIKWSHQKLRSMTCRRCRTDALSQNRDCSSSNSKNTPTPMIRTHNMILPSYYNTSHSDLIIIILYYFHLYTINSKTSAWSTRFLLFLFRQTGVMKRFLKCSFARSRTCQRATTLRIFIVLPEYYGCDLTQRIVLKIDCENETQILLEFYEDNIREFGCY